LDRRGAALEPIEEVRFLGQPFGRTKGEEAPRRTRESFHSRAPGKSASADDELNFARWEKAAAAAAVGRRHEDLQDRAPGARPRGPPLQDCR